MMNFFRGALALLAGLLALLFLWVGVSDALKGGYRVLAGALIYVVWFGFTSWSAIGRIRAEKKKSQEELASIVTTLEALPFDQAIVTARKRYISFPTELALRKIVPTGKEWLAFEWQTVQFVVERVEPGARTRITFVP